MSSLCCSFLYGFKVIGWRDWLLVEVIGICRVPIELITVWELCCGILSLSLWMALLWKEVVFVGALTHEWLHVGVKLFILVSDFILLYAFWAKCTFIPWLSFQWNKFILILHSWNNLLSHLWLIRREVLSIWRVDISIWLMLSCFYRIITIYTLL